MFTVRLEKIKTDYKQQIKKKNKSKILRFRLKRHTVNSL